MLSATLLLLESRLISLPKDLANSELADFLHDLYNDFQRAIACLGDAVGEEIRTKRAAIPPFVTPFSPRCTPLAETEWMLPPL